MHYYVYLIYNLHIKQNGIACDNFFKENVSKMEFLTVSKIFMSERYF